MSAYGYQMAAEKAGGEIFIRGVLGSMLSPYLQAGPSPHHTADASSRSYVGEPLDHPPSRPHKYDLPADTLITPIITGIKTQPPHPGIPSPQTPLIDNDWTECHLRFLATHQLCSLLSLFRCTSKMPVCSSSHSSVDSTRRGEERRTSNKPCIDSDPVLKM